MLTNKDIKHLCHTQAILENLFFHLVVVDNKADIYKTIGLTEEDVYNNMVAMKQICIQEMNKHTQATKQSCDYKKAHRKRVSIVQNITRAKKLKDTKKLDYWTNKLKEYDKKGDE